MGMDGRNSKAGAPVKGTREAREDWKVLDLGATHPVRWTGDVMLSLSVSRKP